MLQIRHIGGDRVGKGNYWNFSTGDRVTMEAEGTLPGNDETLYYKANPFVVIAAAPILGLIYAVFLPFIGIAILLIETYLGFYDPDGQRAGDTFAETLVVEYRQGSDGVPLSDRRA